MSMDINCDVTKCPSKVIGVASEYSPGEGWHRIQMSSFLVEQKNFHICPNCASRFGINFLPSAEDAGQVLLDVIYDIVNKVVEDQDR